MRGIASLPNRCPAAALYVLPVVLLALLMLGPSPCFAQSERSTHARDLTQQTLPLRTALHHDPTLEAPLTALLKLYRQQNRADELIGLYAQHLQRWPGDVSARVVWIRLKLATDDPATLAAARAAAEAHPEHAYLHHLLYQTVSAAGREGGLEHLDRAIELENDPRRQREWIEQFLPLAKAAGLEDRVAAHLETLAAVSADDPQQQVDAAKRMIEFDHAELALHTLAAAADQPMAAELSVDLEAVAARAEADLGQTEQAARRLERLLDRLAPDYWRRPQIVRQRLALIDSDAQRQAVIAAARKRVADAPNDPVAALELADLLLGFDRHREALDALTAAGRRMPDHPAIVTATLDLFDRLRDETGRADYLRELLAAHPDRRTLRLALVRTLYLLGRNKKAGAHLEIALEGLTADERFNHLLETARFCRQSSLIEPAAPLFARALELQPHRLAVMRELAEIHLALGQRGEVRELFDKPVATDAAIEDVLDLSDYLIRQDFLNEARPLIESRIETWPTHLELRLLLLRIHGKQLRATAGADLIDATRAMTDTPARYRRWLQSAVDFHAQFDTQDAFVTQEMERLLPAPASWTELAVERRLIFADLARHARATEQAKAVVEAALAQQPSRESALALRQAQLDLLQRTNDLETLRDALIALAEQDTPARHAIRARLALLYAQQGRHDQVRPLVDDLDLTQINDVPLLGRLEDLFRQMGLASRVAELIERQVQVDPTSRGHWERWLVTLAAHADEQRFRTAVRKLIAGVDRLELAPSTRSMLHGHLLGSYWRSVSRLAQQSEPAAWQEALGQLEAAQRIVNDDAQLTWILWMRAATLNRLGRTTARDQAIAELERSAGPLPRIDAEDADNEDEAAAADDANNAAADDGGRWIVFPDGLAMLLAEATTQLTRSAPRPTVELIDPMGPTASGAPLEQRWSFRTGGDPVVAMLDGPADELILCGASGDLWAIHKRSGKLLWREANALPRTPASMTAAFADPRGSVNTSTIPSRPFAPVPAGSDRVVTSDGKQVVCYDLRARRVVWRAPLGLLTEPSTPHTNHVALAVDAEGVLAHDPARDRLLWFDLDSGKLTDELRLAAPGPSSAQPRLDVSWLSAGMHRHGDRLLVYGPTVAIVDLARREVAWRLDPRGEAAFPIELRSPDDLTRSSAGSAAAPPITTYSTGSHRTVQMHWGLRRPGSPVQVTVHHAGRIVNHQQVSFQQAQQMASRLRGIGRGRISLSSPAVAWSGNSSPQGRFGQLTRDRAMLISNNQLIVWKLDRPMGAAAASGHGTYLGMRGATVCFVNQSGVSLVDTEGQAQRQANPQIGRITDATIDGPLVHLSGENGAAAVNIATTRTVWRHLWDDVDGLDEDPPDGRPRGMVASISVHRTSHGQVDHHYHLGGIVTQHSGDGRPGLCRPMSARVSGGMLFARRGVDEVIALGEAASR